MGTEAADARGSLIELRQQTHSWQAQHARATEREATWKDKAVRFERGVHEQPAPIAEFTQPLEIGQPRVAWLEQPVFGRQSEQTRDEAPVLSEGEASAPPLNRAQLARRVCSERHWLRPEGRSKEMSCRVAKLRMERAGLITLPQPETGRRQAPGHRLDRTLRV